MKTSYNKYGNHKHNGFDSRREEKRWYQLCALEKSGQISGLQRQVRFQLIPSQRINGRVVERACDYVADFVYYEGDTKVVEDCKGFKTDVYRIKRKLFLQRYGIQIRES